MYGGFRNGVVAPYSDVMICGVTRTIPGPNIFLPISPSFNNIDLIKNTVDTEVFIMLRSFCKPTSTRLTLRVPHPRHTSCLRFPHQYGPHLVSFFVSSICLPPPNRCFFTPQRKGRRTLGGSVSKGRNVFVFRPSSF